MGQSFTILVGYRRQDLPKIDEHLGKFGLIVSSGKWGYFEQQQTTTIRNEIRDSLIFIHVLLSSHNKIVIVNSILHLDGLDLVLCFVVVTHGPWKIFEYSMAPRMMTGKECEVESQKSGEFTGISCKAVKPRNQFLQLNWRARGFR